MADKIAVNRVTNATVYMNGQSFIGRAEEVELPTVKQIMQEHKGLGMYGKAKFPAGLDMMEAKFKWNSFDADVSLAMYDPFTSSQLQVRANQTRFGSGGVVENVPVVVLLSGTWQEASGGAIKHQENPDIPSTLNVLYYKQMIDGEDMVEIDVLNNVYKVGGEDILGDIRLNAGA